MCAEKRRDFHFVVESPFQRFRRSHAGDALVESRADCVYVGKGTLLFLARILLVGRIARLHCDRSRGIFRRGGIPGSSEIQQFDRAVVLHADVVRAHVPVNNTFLMELAEDQNDRPEEIIGFLKGNRSAVGDFCIQIRAVQVLHDHVGSAVVLKIVADVDNARFTGKTGEGAGLAEEFLFSGRVGIRQFLDGNGHVKLCVPCVPGRPKSAFSDDSDEFVSVIYEHHFFLHLCRCLKGDKSVPALSVSENRCGVSSGRCFAPRAARQER